jgi:hypothetical protein
MKRKTWRYRTLMLVGLLAALSESVIWITGPAPSAHFQGDPTYGDFAFGAGTWLLMVGGTLFVYGAWLWSRHGPRKD